MKLFLIGLLFAVSSFAIEHKDKSLGTVEIIDRTVKLDFEACRPQLEKSDEDLGLNGTEPHERVVARCYQPLLSEEFELLNTDIRVPNDEAGGSERIFEKPVSAKKNVFCAGSYRVIGSNVLIAVDLFRGIEKPGSWTPQSLSFTAPEKVVARQLLRECFDRYATSVSALPEQTVRLVVLRKAK